MSRQDSTAIHVALLCGLVVALDGYGLGALGGFILGFGSGTNGSQLGISALPGASAGGLTEVSETVS